MFLYGKYHLHHRIAITNAKSVKGQNMFWKKDQSVGSFIIWKIDRIKYQFSLDQYSSNGIQIEFSKNSLKEVAYY